RTSYDPHTRSAPADGTVLASFLNEESRRQPCRRSGWTEVSRQTEERMMATVQTNANAQRDLDTLTTLNRDFTASVETGDVKRFEEVMPAAPVDSHRAADEQLSIGFRVESVGRELARYGLVAVVGWIGCMKFTAYE